MSRHTQSQEPIKIGRKPIINDHIVSNEVWRRCSMHDELVRALETTIYCLDKCGYSTTWGKQVLAKAKGGCKK